MASAAKRIISTSKSAETEKITGFSADAVKAPFFLRCAAAFVDYMVVITLPVFWLVAGKLFGETGASLTIGYTVWFFAFLVFLLNFIVLPLFYAQSVGKMMLGLNILKTDGSDIDLAVILRRHLLGYLVTTLTLGIGFLFAAVNSSGRSLHDLIAGTVVIRGRKTPVY